MSWLDNLRIDFRRGDLFAADTEAVAVTVTTEFVAYGKISKRLSLAFGPQIYTQIDGIREKFPEKK